MLVHAVVHATDASGPPAFLAPTAALVVAAAIIGYISVRVRVVPIVGFLLAGVLIGPHQLGLIEDQSTVEAAAEVGVILLLFTIGIEFSIEKLNRIRRWILVGGGLQVALTSLLVLGVLAAAGVAWRPALFTGFLVALSSTAIVLKLLGDSGETSSRRGQLALAMLIFQDLAVVLMVLVVPLLGSSDGGGGSGPADLAFALGKALAIIAIVLVAARRLMPPLLERVARTCSPEVFLLAVVAIVFGTAYLTALAGVSVSLGAFLAGLVVSESRHSAHALGEIQPLQIIFSATFFVSVGMLLDLGFLVDELPLVLAAVALVLLVKTVATGIGAAVLRVGTGTVAGTSLLLAQVGEFSFVLESVGRDAGLSPADLGDRGAQAFIAATVLLMVATPSLAAAGRTVEQRLQARAPHKHATAAGAAEVDDAEGNLRGHVLISGWGRAASALATELRERSIPLSLVTLNPDGAGEAERAGHRVVRGDPTKLHVLDMAGVRTARLVVIAENEPEEAARIARIIRGYSDARIVVRPVGDVDVEELADAGVDAVVDREIASHRSLHAAVLGELGVVAAPKVDATRIVRYPLPPEPPCPHSSEVHPVVPSAEGCEDCLRTGDSWVHLRVCLSCGHVGCCDSSPNRHARAHFTGSDHPYIASVEPGETWAFCYFDNTTVDRPDRPVPAGPARSLEDA